MSGPLSEAKVEALMQLIAASIEANPHELYGYKWCKLSHTQRASKLGMSERTLRRIVGAPPGQAPFVSTCRVIDGVNTVLLRVGEEGPPMPEDEARKMVKVWRSWLNKNVPIHRAELEAEKEKLTVQLKQAMINEKSETDAQIKKINKTLGRLRENETRSEYGCMVGLAKDWPAGLQIELFKMAVNDWTEFMGGVKVVQAHEAAMGTAKPMYFKYPHIKTLRRYHKVAVDMMVMRYQTIGKEPPEALKAINPALWKNKKPK